MKISIIVPIYGVEKYINNHIKSLLRQEYKDLEFIFVNDCSKDKSIEILNEYLPCFDDANYKVKIINHSSNRGLAAARLTGLLHSTGDYVWFIDSDDWIDSQSTLILSKIIREYTPDIVQFSHIEKTIKGDIKRKNYGATYEKLLWLRTYPCIWRNIFRRNFLIENEIYPIEGINFAEDFVMTSRAFSVATNIIVIPEAFLYYYNNMNVDSYTHNYNLKCVQNRIDACNAIFIFYRNNEMLETVKTSMIYVYLCWFIEICKKDSNYIGKTIANDNLIKMYPKLIRIVRWVINHNFSWLLISLLRVYRWVKYDLLSLLSTKKCGRLKIK